MSIRLNKVTRDLNVGIGTVVEFLQKTGIEIESNPNTKISDEQYALLVKEFGKDKIQKEKSERFSYERSHKERKNEVVSLDDVMPGTEDSHEIKIEVPTDMLPKFKTLGKIELDSKPAKSESKPKSEKAKPEKPIVKKNKTEKSAPSTVVVSEEIKEVAPKAPKQQHKNEKTDQPEILTQKEQIVDSEDYETMKEEKETEALTDNTSKNATDGVFRLNSPKLETNIKVTGKIDLSTLNQSTRPKKKSKEERKKEREDKKDRNTDTNNNNNKRTGGLGRPVKADPNKQQNAPGDAEKRKRARIKKEQVVVGQDNNAGNGNSANTRNNNRPNTGGQGGNHPGGKPHPSHPNKRTNDDRRSKLKKPVKAEVSEEEVQKQIKETLARLTSKGKNTKGAKYRREKRDAASLRQQEMLEQEEMESRVLKITEFVTANDLANMMNVSINEVIGTCMSIGMMVSINQRLDAETINIVAEEFGYKTEYVSAEVVEAIAEEEDNEADLVERSPIVTVMGHVDHGKTSLLDNIRKTNVIAGEAGGITQHIGAYNVKLADGRRITFLDTPGHEAFTAMRARGAKVTDIAIIIVAADDNVMPQTTEAINHASAAGVPIIFAINKIDKPGANPEKIKETLAGMNYLVEDWGGKYQSQDISAKQGLGVQELLEKVLLESELLELKANPNKRAVGSIIESSLDKGRGYVSTVLVQNGTLRMGDIVLAGTHFGRVKAMFNERNQRITEAGPAEPVLILGLNGAPQAGDTFHVLETEQEAREIATKREQLQREQGLRTQKMLTLDDIGRRIAVGSFQELNVIVKGDVDGSVEALSDSLIRLSTPEIQVNVIHKAVGQISESDVTLAAASNAIVIGFQVRPSLSARRAADRDGVEIRLYSIIYDAIEEVKSAMEGMLSPEIKEEIVANVEVREVFKITKVGTVAGCMVKEGKIKRNNKIRLIRDGIVVYSGDLGSLKRFKDDVKEVATGYECGLNITNYNDIKVGDIIEAYEEVEVKKTL
ncbi:MAG TPA: translation initiation factor IF-2 [Porphyromonadaceae bacterium]|nr:translation initiation factor IF-2 [Porphyromonadaceae bacterium]